MGFVCFLAVYRLPGAPYGRKKSEKITKNPEFQGGQHLQKSAIFMCNKLVIFGKNMFFWTSLDFFKNIVFQSISQSVLRQ